MKLNRAVTLGLVLAVMACKTSSMIGEVRAQSNTDVTVIIRCGEKHSWTDANGVETVTQDGPYDCCAAAKSAAFAFAHQRQRLTTDQSIALGKMTQYIKASCP
jgi:hypothetical protein